MLPASLLDPGPSQETPAEVLPEETEGETVPEEGVTDSVDVSVHANLE